jgi:hypothetical protein
MKLIKEIPNLTKLKVVVGCLSTIMGVVTLINVMTPIPQVTPQNIEVSRLNGRVDFTIAPAPYADTLKTFVAHPLILMGLLVEISSLIDIARILNNKSKTNENTTTSTNNPINKTFVGVSNGRISNSQFNNAFQKESENGAKYGGTGARENRGTLLIDKDEDPLVELFTSLENGELSTENGNEMDESENNESSNLEPSINTYKPNNFQTVVSNSRVSNNNREINLIQEILIPKTKSLFMVGVGGAGKGMLTSVLIRQLKTIRERVTIFYIDPKDNPKEYGYTEGICEVIRRKRCFGQSAVDICQWVNEVLDEFMEWQDTQVAPLLIIDEGSILGDAADKCKDDRIGSTILHVAALGDSDEIKIWLMGQAPYIKGLGNLTNMSQIEPIGLIADKTLSVLKSWSKSSLIPHISVDEATRLTKASPVGRAVYYN